MQNTKERLGFSLIEMLIVVGVFSVLAIIITQTLASSLRSSKKSDNLGKVRENVEYAMNYIERTLRTAKRLDFDDIPVGVPYDRCDDGDNNILYFYNGNGVSENFTYIGSPTYAIRYNGSNITSNSIRVTAFSITCTSGISGEPDSVTITITAQDSSTTTSAESVKYTATTRISLRNYSKN